jgi:hypothetical protein
LNEGAQIVENQHTTWPHTAWPASQNTPQHVSTHPICALKLVYYRTSSGCELHQIQTVLESRFKDKESFQNTIVQDSNPISRDEQFFQALRDVYMKKMCGFWRRTFFLKTFRGIRLLSVSSSVMPLYFYQLRLTSSVHSNFRPAVVPLDEFVLQEIIYAYQNPSKITTEHEWIHWVFRLRQQDLRHALEFVEAWNPTGIAVVGLIPLLVSTVLGIVWGVQSGIQDGFAIAGFILTAGNCEFYFYEGCLKNQPRWISATDSTCCYQWD